MTLAAERLLDQEPPSCRVLLAAPPGWPPPPGPVAYHGLMGEIVSRVEPDTEADPIAILSQLLIAFGTAVGRGAYFEIEATRHHPHEFLLLVGDSARARKGIIMGSRAPADLRGRPDARSADPHRTLERRGVGVGGARPRRQRSRRWRSAAVSARAGVRQRPEERRP